MSKKKKTMADILATHGEINRFAINRYHNDGKGFPIFRELARMGCCGL